MTRDRIVDLVRELERITTDPTAGLQEDLFRYVSRITPLVNVDLLIKDENNGVLLTWRDDREHGTGWHIPGGIIRFRETFGDRIHAVARNELGASVRHAENPVAINQIISSTNSIRGHFISLLFECKLTSSLEEKLAAGNRPEAGQWRWHKTCPPDLIAVHAIYQSLWGNGG